MNDVHVKLRLSALILDLKADETRTLSIVPSDKLKEWCSEFENRVSKLSTDLERELWVKRAIDAGLAILPSTTATRDGTLKAFKHPTSDLRIVLQQLRVFQGVEHKDAVVA